jgi:prepilin-type N-terminal cleavage/methylation domain-containing protein
VRRRDGFTLLEVMIAIFVLGTVVGAILQLMQGHLARLADARQELHAARLAEGKLRELQAAAVEGMLPDVGREDGVFDPPHDYLEWELTVEEAAVPLPEDLVGSPPPSTIFAVGGPVTGDGKALQPSLLRISLRVFPDQAPDPETFTPYVLYMVRPVDEAVLEALGGGEDELPGEPAPSEE